MVSRKSRETVCRSFDPLWSRRRKYPGPGGATIAVVRGAGIGIGIGTWGGQTKRKDAEVVEEGYCRPLGSFLDHNPTSFQEQEEVRRILQSHLLSGDAR